jgi:hypothetical protein
MQFVTIPFDYNEQSAANQAVIVPICVARNDAQGNPIAWRFEALSRIPERMISLARRYLDNVWRAAQLSEGAPQFLIEEECRADSARARGIGLGQVLWTHAYL